MRVWLDLLQDVLTLGEKRPDRTGVGTLSLFGLQAEFDNSDRFPAVTTKRLAFGQVAAELAAFLHGYDRLTEFHSVGCNIWDDNGTAEYWTSRGNSPDYLGRIYGVQWRRWISAAAGTTRFRIIDQLSRLIEGLRQDPFGRRHLVTAWNPGELDQMCLPPCHVLWQCYVRGAENPVQTLDLRVDMRSVDLFLGLPFDVASYALLQRLLAREVGMRPGKLVFQLGDAHIYLNHLDQVHEVLLREPLTPPRLLLRPDSYSRTFMPHQAALDDYFHHPAVKAPLNV